jgi:hypothetical protein
MEGFSSPNFKTSFSQRVKLICGEEPKIDRLVLRRAIENEISSVKLVWEVLHAMQTE